MNITDISAERHESKTPIRLAAYCRVSTDYEDQKQSFASQIRYYSEYTQKHTEYQLVDIYADEGLSGTDMRKKCRRITDHAPSVQRDRCKRVF